MSNNSSENSPSSDVPANARNGVSQDLTAPSDCPIPEYSDSLKETWAVAYKELPQAHGVEKLLNEIGMSIIRLNSQPASRNRLPFSADLCWKADVQNGVTLSQGGQTVVNTLVVPVKALMDTSHIADNIRKGVNTFIEAAPILMKTLDDVARIHPFIGGANVPLSLTLDA